MIRKIITIDQKKCNGCGLCVSACHEGAIGLVQGKAVLLRDDYCDGLGDCLPACPVDAITFVEREADAYDEAAVQRSKAAQQRPRILAACPSSRPRPIPAAAQDAQVRTEVPISQLRQFPVQIQLVPSAAPFFKDADLLIAADCAAYCYGDFHHAFMKGKVTLVGCPKLDPVDYRVKLLEIFQKNDIKSVTVTRMEVPCCGGLSHAVTTALEASGKAIPLRVVVLSTDGRIVN